MKNRLILLSLLVLAFALNACQPEEEITQEENRLKALLHQQRWQVVAMTATPSDSTTVEDWYASLPDCVRDNVFVTEAPGTGAVGELHAGEGGDPVRQATYPTVPTLPDGS